MAGLLNAKQLVDGSVTSNKLSERYLQVNEQGEVKGDLIVNGNTTLSETATYKGLEIATKADLYNDAEVRSLIDELDGKKQDKLIAGDHITLSDKDVIGVDYDRLHDQLVNDNFIKSDSLTDYYTKTDVDDIIDQLDIDHATTADRLTTPRNIWGQPFDGSEDITSDLTVENNVHIGGSLVQTGRYTTYFDVDLSSKVISFRSYTKKVLLLHPLDADLYPISLQGRHSVQGEFYINRYVAQSGAAGAAIKVNSCTGYSLDWGKIPAMSVINGGVNAIISADLNNQENTICFCECLYQGTLYRAIYFSGNQVVEYVGFSGKVYNADDNFGKVVEYYKFYSHSLNEPADEILNEEIYNSIELKDNRHIEQHILVGSSSIYGNLVVGRKKSATDGKSGVYIDSSGGIEISHGSTPFIDFHYANSKENYTSRIIEDIEGRIKIVAPNGVLINDTPVATMQDLQAMNSTVSQATSSTIAPVCETLSHPTQLVLAETTDLRYTNTKRKTGTLKLSGGIEGKEYRYSINNEAVHELKLTLQDGNVWMIPAGEVGILKIYYLFDKYICRIIR